MGTYKGNVGNLMQHWTLCEILNIATAKKITGLNYIDAHAMAPLATVRTTQDLGFDDVRDGLPGQESVYEWAWDNLVRVRHEGYPSSAAFLQEVWGNLWRNYYRLLLSETRLRTADEIRAWLFAIRRLPGCMEPDLFQGDWRIKFEEGLPSPFDLGLPDNSLTLVSFDPYSFRIEPLQPPGPDGMLYPGDLELTLQALQVIEGGVLIQLSTYSSQENPQNEVRELVNLILDNGGFMLAAEVVENVNMMSLVYVRNVNWANELEILPDRYLRWRGR
jgi:hypothetical protein